MSVFCLGFPLRVLWSLALHFSLWSILSLFLCMVLQNVQSRFNAWYRVLRAGALGWPEGWYGEGGGRGFWMGNTCTPMADSSWCMAKPILPGASTGDPTHDKGHEEEAWQAKVSQDSRDPLDLLKHLSLNQNLPVLLFFTNSTDTNGGLSPTTFLWRKLT